MFWLVQVVKKCTYVYFFSDYGGRDDRRIDVVVSLFLWKCVQKRVRQTEQMLSTILRQNNLYLFGNNLDIFSSDVDSGNNKLAKNSENEFQSKLPKYYIGRDCYHSDYWTRGNATYHLFPS